MNIPFLNASFEDFTTYTETGDTGGHLSQNSTHAIWDNLDRNYDTWIYKDYGVGYFTDFEHEFTFEITDIEAGDSSVRAMLNIWVLSEQNTKAHPNDALVFYAFQDYADDNEYGITFFQRDNGATGLFISQSSYDAFDVGIIYYVTISRDGTTCRAIVYTDSARTNILWDSGDKTGVSDNYQYVILTQGYDFANDPNDYSSGYLTEFEFIAYLTITFRFNDGGEFRVDNATISNGTETTYKNETVLELASLPLNSSYVFSIFEWDSTNATTNPYNLTLTSNSTVWCYFDVAGVVGGYAGFSYLFFGLIIGVVVGALVLASKNH